MGQVSRKVAAGAAISEAFMIDEDYVVTGFVFDAALTQTAVTFTATADGTNYVAVEDSTSAAAVGITAEASKVSMLNTVATKEGIGPLKNFKAVLGGNNTGVTWITALTQKVA